MKWTPQKIQQLQDLCFQRASNKEIATALGCDLHHIYAKRSQLGLTIDKVKAAQQQPEPQQKEDKPVPVRIANPVKEAFSALHSALLVAAANDHISEEKTKAYMSAAASVTELEYLLNAAGVKR